MATATRADMTQAVYEEIGLRLREAAQLVETMIEAIAERLAVGDTTNISGFGGFMVRHKAPRVGRNPKTSEAAMITSRRVVVFRTSAKLKKQTNDARAVCGPDA